MILNRRHRSRYKFTEKTHSAKGMLSTGMAALSLVIFGVAIYNSFSRDGNSSVYLGSIGVTSCILGIVAFVLAVLSLREEDSYHLFPYLAIVLSFLAVGIWITLYITGLIMG